MSTQKYKAFLLRLQKDEGHSQWRATIENAQTGEQLRFANQNQMLRYLFNDLAEEPQTTHQLKKPKDREGN